MVAAVVAFMVVAEALVAGAFMVVVALMVGAEASTVVADITAAGGLLVEEATAEEVTAKAAVFVVGQELAFVERAAVLTAGLKRGAVLAQAEPVRRMFVRRIFVRRSTMASGIRSAAPVVPRV